MQLRTIISATFALLLTTVCAVAEDQIKILNWSELKAKGELKAGEITPAQASGDGDVESREEELLIVNETRQPLTVRLATLEPTGIKKHLYKVFGRIRYEGVKQPGHLETWNHFADGGPYFTKTLSPSGPTGKIHGTSPDREFILPFRSSPKTGPPKRIEVNLVLPAEGKVWISPLHLSEFEEHEWAAATTAAGAWWSERTAGLMGGILGSVLGILGAVVGTLSGRGRGRTFCMAVCWFMLVGGALSLVAGIFALTQSQPYAVYYPLLLLGIISTLVMAGVLPQTRKRFADLELHRMEAMDAGTA